MVGRKWSISWNGAVATALSMTVLFLVFSKTAVAQSPDHKTTVKFNTPIEIPGAGPHVLPAGTYVFKLADPDIDRHVVQILNPDESHVLATIIAIPNARSEASDNTLMTFEERPAGQPPAIHAWFYPGEKWGQEFVYPTKKTPQPEKAAKLIPQN